MIEENIVLESDRLCAWWKEQTKGHPCLKLDYTWPSIGSIDSLSFFLRKHKYYGSERQSFIRSIACYLG